jgi:Resolvase, N terminal domain
MPDGLLAEGAGPPIAVKVPTHDEDAAACVAPERCIVADPVLVRVSGDERSFLHCTPLASSRADKDSETRQRVAIEAFAKRSGATIVDWYYDPAVSGADPIEARPGFSALLDRLESNGVRTVVVQDASRFARDLVAQELGVLLLIKRGVRVLTANGDDLTDTSDPSRVMMRQIAGSFAQYRGAGTSVTSPRRRGPPIVSARGGNPSGRLQKLAVNLRGRGRQIRHGVDHSRAAEASRA